MKKQDLKKVGLTDKPGVYFFKMEGKVLYIGKATSLRDRIRSYFSKDLISTRGPAILDMTIKADKVDWQETESVLEALILEANLIKKYKPKYNTKEKDNKSFNYVCITRDKLPKVLIVRGRGLNKKEYSKIYGPFPNGQQLKEAMKIIRRIFPYFDNDSNKKNNREFYKQLGLVPDIITASQKHQNSSRFTLKGSDADKNFDVLVAQYKNIIKNLKLFFEGKKKSVVANLKKEMLAYAFKKEFEKAGEIKKRIFALNHINDVALVKEEIYGSPTSIYRLEAYDVAHMGGKNMVGVMTVVEDGEVNKNEYRKFIIRTQDNSNDTGALEEILSRRLRHTEWGLPSLIVVDGSTAQVNAAKRVINRYQFDIPIVGVVKDEHHKPKAIMGEEKIIIAYKKEILLANNEAHRFAITFHKQKRNKSFLK
ncbi:MAG: GIY-YIG nuclease family protein [Candidatus Paceibacterota bacterium]